MGAGLNVRALVLLHDHGELLAPLLFATGVVHAAAAVSVVAGAGVMDLPYHCQRLLLP